MAGSLGGCLSTMRACTGPEGAHAWFSFGIIFMIVGAITLIVSRVIN
jgi:hypothetical protein